MPTPQTVNLDEITIEKDGIYLPRKEMKLNYAYPIVVGYSDGNATIDDDEQFHGSLNFSTSKIGGFLSGSYDFFAHYNKDNFYDLFGPTKRSRKGLLFGVNNKKSLIWDNPKNLDLTGTTKIESFKFFKEKLILSKYLSLLSIKIGFSIFDI